MEYLQFSIRYFVSEFAIFQRFELVKEYKYFDIRLVSMLLLEKDLILYQKIIRTGFRNQIQTNL